MAMWSEYAWAVGHDVDLADLVNVEDDLLDACDGLYVHPTNAPIDRLPVRERTLDGEERGEGTISHVWNFVLPLAAIQYIITEYFTVGGIAVPSRDMTINTFDVELGTFTRWNAKVARPKPNEDYTYDVVDQLTTDLRLRMVLLEEL